MSGSSQIEYFWKELLGLYVPTNLLQKVLML